MASQDQILDAAAELEQLAAVAKQMVLDMRADAIYPYTRDNAYARVYWLRARISREIVAKLGAGTPTGLKRLDTEYLNDGLV